MVYLRNRPNINGKVVDKYRLENGNIGVIVEEENRKRYSVEFQVRSVKPCLSNLYGLLEDPFQGKSKSLEKLIKKDNYIGVNVSSSENPIRLSYRLNYVSDVPLQSVMKLDKPINIYKTMGYRSAYI